MNIIKQIAKDTKAHLNIVQDRSDTITSTITYIRIHFLYNTSGFFCLKSTNQIVRYSLSVYKNKYIERHTKCI